MTMQPIPNGTIRRIDEGYAIVFVRRLKKPIEKVWTALTVPERIADWFTEMRFVPELRLGARVELRFPDDDPPYEMTQGEVVALEPPRLLAWTWRDGRNPVGLIRCQLEPEGDGCVLTFSESGPLRKELAWGASGWQVFLNGLEGATAGVRAPGDLEREKGAAPGVRGATGGVGIRDSAFTAPGPLG